MKTTNHAEKVEQDETRTGAMHPSGIVRVAKRSTPEHDVAASLVDALDDILKWERQSERLVRTAGDGDDKAS